MEIYKTKFMQVIWNKADNLFEVVWFPTTKQATKEDYINWNTELVKRVLNYKPLGILADSREFYFKGFLEMRSWVVTNMLEPYVSVGLNKIAIIASTNFLSKFSIEQLTEDYKDGKIVTKYFDNLEEGKAWLLKKRVRHFLKK